MKIKKLLNHFLLYLVLATLGGCGKGSDNTDSNTMIESINIALSEYLTTNQSYPLIVNAFLADGTSRTIESNLNWSISNEKLATISNNGLLQIKNTIEELTITVSLDDITSSQTFNIIPSEDAFLEKIFFPSDNSIENSPRNLDLVVTGIFSDNSIDPNLTMKIISSEYEDVTQKVLIKTEKSLHWTHVTNTSEIEVFPLTVEESTAPVITSEPVTSVKENDVYVYDINISNDNDKIIYYALQTYPTGMQINEKTGIIEWTPSDSSAGKHEVTAVVTDVSLPDLSSTIHSYSITVAESNLPPIVNPIPTKNIASGNLYNYSIQAEDKNGDLIEYKLESFPKGMSVDSNGVISWTPTNEQIDEHTIKFIVSDNGNPRMSSALQEFRINVYEPNVNIPPTIISQPLVSAKELQTYTYQVVAEDSNNDKLIFKLNAAPEGMTIDKNTGVIEWTPTATQAAVHNVEVTVIDNGEPAQSSKTQSFDIAVAESNVAPSIVSTPKKIVTEEDKYLYSVIAHDENNDIITFKLVNAPSGMQINAESGQINWIPTENQAGKHVVEIIASDNGDPILSSTAQIFELVVKESNIAPVIQSTAHTEAIEKELYTYNIKAHDENGDNLTFSLETFPPGMVINMQTGLVNWTPSKSQADMVHKIKIVVKDDGVPPLSSSAQEFFIDVSAKAPQQEKPNIILVVADDLGYGDLSSYGSKTISTPNLDKLAEDGIRLTDFYAAPACGPLRASLMTGTYPARIGNSYTRLPNAKTGVHHDELTLAEMLQGAGYSTALIGKWHLGDNTEFMPWNQGFDYYYGLPYSNDMWPFHPLICPHENEDPRLIAARERTAITGCEGCGTSFCIKPDFFPDLPLYENRNVIDTNPEQKTLQTKFTQKALSFIEQNQSNPFFLYFPTHAPHVPLHPSDEFRGTSAGGLYGDVVEELDASIGKMIQKLEELNLRSNTMFIFMSDNGPWIQYGIDGGSTGPLRGSKHNNYEGSVRTPAILNWPDKIPSGQVSSEIVHAMDILPTIAGITNLEVPTNKIIDGQNIWPILSGQANAKSQHTNLMYYNDDSKLKFTDQTLNIAAIRNNNWKLHLDINGYTLRGSELYDLSNDLGESKNIISNHPQIVAQLVSVAQNFNDTLRTNSRPMGHITQIQSGLTLALSNTPTDINLSAFGKSDWIHWGMNNVVETNRKNVHSAIISDFSSIGPGIPGVHTPPSGNGVKFYWNDGSPSLTAETNSLVFVNGVNNGFKLNVPANSLGKVLNLHIGTWKARGEVKVEMSGNSSAPQHLTIDSASGTAFKTVTIHFSTSSSNASLNVSYTMDKDYNDGNLSMLAATLQ